MARHDKMNANLFPLKWYISMKWAFLSAIALDVVFSKEIVSGKFYKIIAVIQVTLLL